MIARTFLELFVGEDGAEDPPRHDLGYEWYSERLSAPDGNEIA